MKQNSNSFSLFKQLTKISWIIFIIGIIWFFIPSILGPLFSRDYYFNYKMYKEKEVKVDTMALISGAKSNKYHFRGLIFKKEQFYVSAKNDTKMDSIFQINDHKLLVFFKDYESPAYFVEDDFQEMTFKTIWYPILRNLGIFILIMINFFFWRYKYHQAILATGVSLKEYEKQMESKRPKRKTLSEEYEELMQKENEKKHKSDEN